MQHLLLSGLAALAPLAPAETAPTTSVSAPTGFLQPSTLAAERRQEDDAALPPDGPRYRWYAKLHAGFGVLDDGGFDATSGGTTTPGDGSYDSGLLSGFALGYRFDRRWSAELEYTYRTNDIDSIEQSGSTFASGGDYASVAILANAFYHFRPGERLRPYVGAGVGLLQEIDADLESSSVEASDRGGFAWQVMAGVDYQLSDRWNLNFEGRYFDGGSPTLDVEGSSDSYDADYRHLGLLAGVSYSF